MKKVFFNSDRIGSIEKLTSLVEAYLKNDNRIKEETKIELLETNKRLNNAFRQYGNRKQDVCITIETVNDFIA